jgi:hypothetical protein
MHPIPVLVWLLANIHKWLTESTGWKNGISCKLTIIPCSYYEKCNTACL